MSEVDYLDDGEPILFQWSIRETETEMNRNVLGVTKRRVFHFKRYGRDWTYRDMPLEKITFLENGWHGKSIILIIIGIIGVILGIILFFLSFIPYQVTSMLIYFDPFTQLLLFIGGIILLIAGIITIIKGIKEYGYILINSVKWKFDFKRSKDIIKIQKMIKIIYSLLNQ